MSRLTLFSLFLALFTLGCTKSEPVTIMPVTVGLNDISVAVSTGIATIDLQLSSALAEESSLTIRTLDDTALSGIDYVTPTTSKIVFPAGVTRKSVSIVLLNDHIKRPDRIFAINITDSYKLSLTKSKALIKIINDNVIPEVLFSSAAQVVSKTSGLASIQLNLSIPATQRFDVPYSISGTATPNIDHKFQSGIATFLPGSTSVTVSGIIVNTQTAGLNKTVVVTIGSVSGLAIGDPGAHTVVIADGNASLMASLSGAPQGTNNERELNVTVSGANVANYRYKVTSSNSCDDPSGYSSPISVSQKITENILALPDGLIFLCVQGGNGQGIFQSAQASTVVSWTKNTNPPAPPGLVGITSRYRQLSPQVYLSNSATIAVQFSGLKAGYSVALYDSYSCAAANVIGKSPATGTSGVFSGIYSGDGDHALSAKLFDQFDQGSICLPILSKYTLDTVIPTVTDISTLATSGYYGAGSDIQILITFSKDVVVTGPSSSAPYLTLNTSPDVAAARFISVSGNKALFDYRPALFQNSVIFDYFSQQALVPSGSTIQDLAGNSVYLLLPAPGSVGSLSSKVNILVDTTPPQTIAGFQDGNFSQTTTTPVFTWVESSDPGGSGVSKYQVAIGSTQGGIDVLPWTDAQTNSFSRSMNLVANQTYFGSVRAVDRAGNTSLPTLGNGWQVDPSSPSVPTVSISATSTFDKSQSPVISWTAVTDSGSGLDHYEVALGTAQGLSNIVPWTAVTSQTLTHVFYYGGGQYGSRYHASVRAVDRAGNLSTGYAPSFLNAQPNIDPVPALAFTDLTEITSGTQVLSETRTIQGLQINVQASVTSDKGVAFIVVNGGAPTSSSTVKNGDTIAIQTTASAAYQDTIKSTLIVGGSTYIWSVTSWGCPSGYVRVPATAPDAEFCVAKYKMSLSSGVAVSQTNLDPVVTDKFAAEVLCQQNGANYSLISNRQYQILSQNAELVASNWSSGTAKIGTLSGGIINSAVYAGTTYEAGVDSNPCHGASGLTCSPTIWSKYRRTMNLSTGDVIWDLAGGRHGQWVSTEDTSANLIAAATLCSGLGSRPADGLNGSVLTPGFNPQSQCVAKLSEANGNISSNYGPSSNYIGIYPDVGTWGGLGYLAVANSNYSGSVWISRGGSINDEAGSQYWHGGLFSTVGFQPVQGASRANFRCVYNH